MASWLRLYQGAADAVGGALLDIVRAGSGVPTIPPTASWPLTSAGAMIAFAYGYLLLVGLGSALMKNRDPVRLPMFQNVYNVVQVVLCSCMCCAAVTIAIAERYPVVCVPFNAEAPPMAGVLWLFYVSKVLDFVDTFFIVIGKKSAQLSFLHVYHHWSIYQLYWMLLWVGYDGDVYVTIVLNSFIHAIMYSYYLCSARGKDSVFGRAARMVKPYVTSLQLIQFCLMITQGVVLMGWAFSEKCRTFPERAVQLYVGYIFSMLVLFGRFFKKSYMSKSGGKAKTA